MNNVSRLLSSCCFLLGLLHGSSSHSRLPATDERTDFGSVPAIGQYPKPSYWQMGPSLVRRNTHPKSSKGQLFKWLEEMNRGVGAAVTGKGSKVIPIEG